MSIMALAGIGFALQVYGIYSSAEEAAKNAKLQKQDIQLQRESAKLNEEARKMQEELAEAKVRKDVRKAQANRLTRSAISGTDFSSSDVAIGESITTESESGLAASRELSGIQSTQASIQSDRLGIASNLISKPSDLDTILGYTGSAVSLGVTAYTANKFAKPTYTTDYSSPVKSQDFEYTP